MADPATGFAGVSACINCLNYCRKICCCCCESEDGTNSSGQSITDLSATVHSAPANEQQPTVSQQPVAPTETQPASTVQLPMSQQPVAPTETHPPASHQPYNGSSATTGEFFPSVPVPQSPNKRVTKEHMQKIADNLVPWERLAVALGISNADVKRFQAENCTQWDQAYCMLCKWKDTAYKKARVGEFVSKCQEADVSIEVYEFLLVIECDDIQLD